MGDEFNGFFMLFGALALAMASLQMEIKEIERREEGGERGRGLWKLK